MVSELLEKSSGFSGFFFVIPGKRPVVFIKEILKEKNYNGIIPEFFTIDEYLKIIAEKQEIKGIALWLIAYQTYSELYSDEDLMNFLNGSQPCKKIGRNPEKIPMEMIKKFWNGCW